MDRGTELMFHVENSSSEIVFRSKPLHCKLFSGLFNVAPRNESIIISILYIHNTYIYIYIIHMFILYICRWYKIDAVMFHGSCGCSNEHMQSLDTQLVRVHSITLCWRYTTGISSGVFCFSLRLLFLPSLYLYVKWDYRLQIGAL